MRMSILAVGVISASVACSPATKKPTTHSPISRDGQHSQNRGHGSGAVRVIENTAASDETLSERALSRTLSRDEKARKTTKQLNQIDKQPVTIAANAPTQQPTPPQNGPDPSVVYSIDITNQPFRGPKNAVITIVEAGEYACPYCFKVRPTLQTLLAEYPGKIKIVHMSLLIHPIAKDAAIAACAAHQQGRFKAMDQLIWDKGYGPYRSTNSPEHLGAKNLRRLARRARLKLFRYDRDLLKCRNITNAAERSFKAMGISGTPSFWINGRYLRGAQPLQPFRNLIDTELKLATERIARGDATAANYYQRFVVEKDRR